MLVAILAPLSLAAGSLLAGILLVYSIAVGEV